MDLFYQLVPGFGALIFYLIFLGVLLVIPIIMIIKFFQISSDVRNIKNSVLSANANISSKLDKIENKMSEKEENRQKQETSTGIWGDSITLAEKTEAQEIIPRLKDMDGVIICDIKDQRLDIWSRYYWEKYGKIDTRYKLIYKNFID